MLFNQDIMNKLLQKLKNITSRVAFFIVLLAGIFNGGKVLAQAPPSVSVNVNIVPPYSPYYSDYSGSNANKVFLIIHNNTATQQKIKLTGKLEGDNGVRITTYSNYMPLAPVILNPFETKQLNGTALKDIFDLNNLNVYGIDKGKLARSSRLPEGNYNLCIQAVDYNEKKVLSVDNGCATISIVYPDAPILVNPIANSTEQVLQGATNTAQTVVFNWINAGYAPPSTQYNIQVAEMPNTPADPNQILNAVSFPVINKTVTGFSYILSPLDPPLKVGKRYAWRVKAIDQMGLVVFKNNGISAASQFRYGEVANVPSVLTLVAPEANTGLEKVTEANFQWKFLDNSAQNDPVTLPAFGRIGMKNNFGGLTLMAGQVASSDKKYDIYIARVKTAEEKSAENRKLAIAKRMNQPAPAVDKGIMVSSNTESITYESSEELKKYVLPGNNYEWYVRNSKTGAQSEKRIFSIKKAPDVNDYVISLNGRIKYNFSDNIISAMSKKGQAYLDKKDVVLNDKEKGFDLAYKTFQVLKVPMLAKVVATLDSVETVEGGKNIKRFGLSKNIQVVNTVANSISRGLLTNNYTVVGNGTTDSIGNFEVRLAIQRAQYKVIDSAAVIYTQFGSTKPDTLALVDGLVIKVNDARFADPLWFVVPDPDKPAVVLEENTVPITEYKLNVAFNTDHQRNYKGNLYVLKSKPEQLVKGEVDNNSGQAQDASVIKQVLAKKINSFQMVTKQIVSTGSYLNVGSKPIEIAKESGGATFNFNNLVADTNPGNTYQLYFEPMSEQNSLFFPLQSVNLKIPEKAGYTPSLGGNIPQVNVTLGPQYINMRISGRYVYQWKQQGKAAGNAKMPLPEGTTLVLMKGYLTSVWNKDGFSLDEQKVLKETTVGKNGAFNFDLGVIDYNTFNYESKEMVIVVKNASYYSDPTTIEYNKEKDVAVPELLATVKQFTLKSRVGYVTGGVFKGLKGMNVYLCRYKGAIKPVGFPDNEGDPNHKNYFKTSMALKGITYEIIDKTESSAGTGSLAEGGFNFDRLVMPDLGDLKKSYEYFILAEPKSDAQINYITEDPYMLGDNVRFINHNDIENAAKYNFSASQTIYNIDYSKNSAYVVAVAQRPTIDGAVYPYSNTSTSILSGVTIDLFDMHGVAYKDDSPASMDAYIAASNNRSPERTTMNGSNGRFLFDDFGYPQNGVGTNITSWKMLRLSKQGFITTYFTVQEGTVLRNGDRANLAKLYLNLPLEYTATVENEQHQPVAARIIVGDDFSWVNTVRFGQVANLQTGQLSPGYEQAKLTSPKGLVKLTIIPNDKGDYKTTEVFVNVDTYTKSVGRLEVKRNMRSIVVTCIDGSTNKTIAANVSITNITDSYEQKMNDFGIFGGKFTVVTTTAGGNQFDIKVIPVDNFTIALTQVRCDVNKDAAVTVYVYPAGTIKVTGTEAGADGKPKAVSSFGVAIMNRNADEYIVTKSGTGGYMISRLPMNDANSFLTMFTGVIGYKSGYIGETVPAYLMDASTQYAQIHFKPIPAGIPESLYNFPVIITKATPSGDKYIINGMLNPANNAEKSGLTPANPNNWLNFYDVTIKPGQNPAMTVYSDLQFHENELPALYNKTYRVNITDAQGLKISPQSKAITGFVQLDPASLSKGLRTSESGKAGDAQYLYLNRSFTQYAPDMNITLQQTLPDFMNTFSGNTTDVSGTVSLLVSNAKRQKVTFTLANDLYVTPTENVYISNYGIKFKGIVNTYLDNVNAANKNVQAQASFTITNNGFSTSDEKPLSIGLNQWKMEASAWSLTNNGLVIKKGFLNALGLTIPFSDLPVSYSKIGYGTFDVKQLRLLNAFDITLNANDVKTSFGFDKGYSSNKGAWSVSILANSSSSSLASLRGLPDLAPTDAIQINNINLYDTGDPADTRILLTKDQPAVTLNRIAKFSPAMVAGGKDFVSFIGGLDLNIPNLNGLQSESYELVYKVIDGQFKHDTTSSFKNLTLDANGVFVKFNDQGQKFSNDQFTLVGTLTDKEKPGAYSIPIMLGKTQYLTTLGIPQVPGEKKKMYMGANGSTTYLDDIHGNMFVSSGVWTNFKFGGNLITPNGTDKDASKMNFEIKGDLVADNQKVGVNNMGAGGVGGLSITYDFDKKALVGSCHLDQETDFATIAADMDMYIGGDKWYLFANGVAKDIKSSPITEAAFGMMVGNAPLTADQLASLHKHFKNEVPPNFDKNFSSVSGLLIITSIDVPIPILPTLDIDLDPVAHCEFKHGIYGNFYFNAGFSTKKEDLSMVIGARLGGYVKVGAGASIGLACANISLGADIHADASGALRPFSTSKPKIELGLGIEFTLNGSAYVGAGICNSHCETPCVKIPLVGKVCSPIPCVKVGLTKSITINLGAEMTENSFKLNSQTSN
jgi:hypothetical protein